ncbi:hypothetical protein DER46DRAFT_668484 [Fusarium sp. MPI-SDFR-AT-0072]|nr:hypothetical protein DER46DRAFT_668484 [Fusarium sp. MPI-SDFR-AT-0072]
MDKLLEELPLFTLVMICVVAILDHFASRSVVQPLLYKISSELLDPTERGLETLRSQYTSRPNAWRSTACIRGLSDAVEKYKEYMLGQGKILLGYMLASETPHEGIKAAAAAEIGIQKYFDRSEELLVVNVEEPLAQFTDIQYSIFDQGADVERKSSRIMTLAESLGLVLNQELIEGPQNSLHRVSEDIISWFIATTKVDTATAVSQTVEGCWGFRPESFLHYMEVAKNELPPSNRTSHHLTMPRQQILPLLARLFLGSDVYHSFVDDPRTGATRRSYMGIIGKRKLMINSLLGKCSSPGEIGGFTIIDVDVGGIPRDSQGLICPGVRTEFLESDIMGLKRMSKSTQHNLCEKSTDQDVTFNIEPGWDGNPDANYPDMCQIQGKKSHRNVSVNLGWVFLSQLRAPAPARHDADLSRVISPRSRSCSRLSIDHVYDTALRPSTRIVRWFVLWP